MRKRNTTKVRLKAAPAIATQLLDVDSQIKQQSALLSFRTGSARREHIDVLMRVYHLLHYAELLKPGDASLTAIVELSKTAFASITHRFRTTGKAGTSGEEFKALEAMLDFSYDFWARQSGITRQQCVTACNTWYEHTNQQFKKAA